MVTRLSRAPLFCLRFSIVLLESWFRDINLHLSLELLLAIDHLTSGSVWMSQSGVLESNHKHVQQTHMKERDCEPCIIYTIHTLLNGWSNHFIFIRFFCELMVIPFYFR